MNAVDEINKLAEMLADAQNRKAFVANPGETAESQGISVGDIPTEVFDTLAGMTYEELRAISMTRDVLMRALGHEVGVIL
ncbi:MAG TPA: hypothetical protein VGR49_04390 [Actinomycetota bacterium]|jgi:hypothetical protein|nr:hypothetical protein [Actinomycetota bacterium]